MLKEEAARTFGVSVSSVKRYVEKAQKGESLSPKKAPGKKRKLHTNGMKLLEEDLQALALPLVMNRGPSFLKVFSG